MFAGRSAKWIFVGVLVLLAVYASYPPLRVPVKKEEVTEKVARTAQEAEEHGVMPGQTYEVGERKEVWKRWLPLARGQKDEEVVIKSREADGTIVKEITTVVPGRINLGLDIAGGTELLYQIKLQEGVSLGGKRSPTISILKRRVDPHNMKEFTVQPVGQNRILIQVPKASSAEVAQLKNRLTRMGKLEFKLAIPPPGVAETKEHIQKNERAEKGLPVEGYEKMYPGGDTAKQFVLVKTGDPEVTGQYLDAGSLRQTVDQYGRPAVGFSFNQAGRARFTRITETYRGWALAIILDGVLKSAPRIRERIAGPGQITGDFTTDEVAEMVTVLKAGSLPVDVELLQETTVGPKLGMDSIRKGLRSIAVAGFLVLVFVGLYYLACGLVADAALILNLVFLVGVLGFMGAALTLPGLAGILLTVGMAVDANVLIFERIREESREGRSLLHSLRNGYDRAYTTIIDANVTTLLTAVILYIVGTGPVRGFAVTLSVGIVLSMFTALFVTRLAFETLLARGWLKRFRMHSVIGVPTWRYSAARRLAYVVSGIIVVGGVVVFFSRGSALYDIDFTGGTLLNLSLAKDTPVEQVRQRLSEAGFGGAEVQSMGRPEYAQQEAADFSVRVKGLEKERLSRSILPSVKERLEAVGAGVEEIKVSDDGRSLTLQASEALTETKLRRALAGSEGDVYRLQEIERIVAAEDAEDTAFAMSVVRGPGLLDEGGEFSMLLSALSWRLQTQPFTMSTGEIKEDGGDGHAEAELMLTLEPAVPAPVLGFEVARRGFPQLAVTAVADSDQKHLLKGPAPRIRQFKREMPQSIELPMAEIEGATMRVVLKEPSDEAELMAAFERQGLESVVIIPLNKAVKAYRLFVSQQETKEKLAEMFADLARPNVEVTFSLLPAENTPPTGAEHTGKAKVQMKLSEPMTLPAIRLYVERAGLGAAAAALIREDAPENVRVSSVTLLLPEEKREELQKKIAESFSRPEPITKVVSIGSAVAEEMKGRALLAVVFASLVIVFYVTIRFHAIKFGVAAVVALIHDVLITVGFIALADWTGLVGDVKINLPMLAAFLTILGYSLNDTIVVFDRIRENLHRLGKSDVDSETVDLSVNQTLSRTILTSLTTLMVVVVLYVLGGAVLRGLAFTLIVGILVGTYSSVFVASPLLLDWLQLKRATAIFFNILFFPIAAPFKVVGALRRR